MTTPAVAHEQVVPDRRRRLLILVICSMSLLIVGLDATIVNIALPAIQRSFHSSLSGLQWTVDAYTLVLASLLMLAGSTADRLGRRRVFAAGLVAFSLGSLLCALAPSLELLVAFRVLQATGGAMLTPVAMSIVRNVFEDPRERARAIGVFAAMFGISMALGPVLGGSLVSAISWRAIFLVNLPVALAAIVLAALFVPESRARRPRRLDPVGQILVIAALAGLTYAIIEGGRVGFGAARIVILLAIALGCFAALVLYELRRREPLLEVRFFASAPFAGASAIAVCLSAALGGFLFMNTLYLQDVRGLSPLHAGLYLLPTATMMIVFAPLSGRLVARCGARPSMVAGGLAVMAGGLMLTGLAPGTSVPFLLSAYAVFGFGFALVSPPIANTAMSGMPPAQAGVAAAVATTSRQVGLTLGVAVFGAVAVGGLGGEIGRGFAQATRPGWWIVAALGLAVAALGYLTTTSWARDTARRTAQASAGQGCCTREDHGHAAGELVAVGEQRGDPGSARRLDEHSEAFADDGHGAAHVVVVDLDDLVHERGHASERLGNGLGDRERHRDGAVALDRDRPARREAAGHRRRAARADADDARRRRDGLQPARDPRDQRTVADLDDHGVERAR
jgi:EmrB/QacA subfamily drug resistance transporter